MRWILGRVVKVCGPRAYLVKTGHKARYVHADHLLGLMIKGQMKIVNMRYSS